MPDETIPKEHICGACGKEFETLEEYLNHKCEANDGIRPNRVVDEEVTP